MGNPITYSDLHPRDCDTDTILLAKILLKLASGGGGGGSGSVIFGSGDPNGSATALRPAIYYDDLGNFWAKTNAANDSAGWSPFIQAQATPAPMLAEAGIHPLMLPMGPATVSKPKLGEAARRIWFSIRPALGLTVAPALPEAVPITVLPTAVHLDRAESVTMTGTTLPASPVMPPVKLMESRRSRVKAFLGALKTLVLSFFSFLPVWVFLCVLNPLMVGAAGFPPPLRYIWTTTNSPTIVTNIVKSLASNVVANSALFVAKAGDTMTGALSINGNTTLNTDGSVSLAAGAAIVSAAGAATVQALALNSGSAIQSDRTLALPNFTTSLAGDATFGGVVTANSFSGVGSSLTALNASQLTSGTVPDARFPATLPAASGVNLTALNASQLTSGTLPAARLSLTSAQLATALTDETGTGSGTPLAVFNQSPVIVTPTIASYINAPANHLNAAGGGTLDAAAITSGTMATARLGSGSATANTLLHGDSSWGALNLANDVTGTLGSGSLPVLGTGYPAALTNLDGRGIVLTNTLLVGSNSATALIHHTNVFQVATVNQRKAFEVNTNGDVFIANGQTNAGNIQSATLNTTGTINIRSSSIVLSASGSQKSMTAGSTIFGENNSADISSRAGSSDGVIRKDGASIWILGGVGYSGYGSKFSSSGITVDGVITATNGISDGNIPRLKFSASEVTLTESTATLVFNVALASGKSCSIRMFASTRADDGTDFQDVGEVITIAAANKAGTVSTAVSTAAPTATIQTSGTLTTTWTAVANGNGVDVKCNAVSSLTQTSLKVNASVEVFGNGTPTITFQ